ncbi:MAG: PAS domain S-box protein [Nitrospirae bacterium]|nr:PAS domain S-box protein [Nitrospirota bacterium]
MKFPDSRFTKGRTIPLRISLIYALVGCLWIVFLSEILPLLIREPGTAVRWEVVTGWVFVGATAGMLYFLIRRDIDAIRKSGEALRESEEKFQMLLDNTASAIFIYRDKILHANPAMETLTGYDGRELLGMDFFTIVHPAFREEIRKRCEALSSGGGAPLRCEFKILRKGGEERWVDFTSSILFYGGALSGLGTLSDMTERKRAEEALRETRS